MSNTVPEGWSSSEMAAFCDVVGGGTPDRSIGEYWGGEIPWASPTEITSRLSKYISETKDSITQRGLEKSSAKLHPPGTVLMTSRASIGFVAINTVPMATNQGFQSLRCKEGALAEYIYQYIIWLRPELEKISAGSTFAEISSSSVKKIRVTLPPLPEQQKIAAILSSVDDVIEKTRAQIDKLKDLKTGMMQELLTKGIGHTAFKDSPVGRIPVSWRVAKLAQVTKVVDSLHQTPKFSNEGFPMIRVSDIKPGKVNTDRAFKVSQEVFCQFTKNHKPQKGDLLMSRVGSYGVCCYLNRDIDVCLGQNTVVIIPDRVDSLFLYHSIYSEAVQNQIEFEVAGSGYKSLSLASIRSLSISLPPDGEQKKIADILASIDDQIETKNRKMKAVSNAKKALMQDLLTGKVRVNVEKNGQGEAVAG